MALKVPIVGTSVVAEGEGVSPAINGGAAPPVRLTETPAPQPQRQSLHSVRMKPQQEQIEVRGEFDSFGRVKWIPVEKAQEQAAQAEEVVEQAEEVVDADDSTVDAGGGALDGVVSVPPLNTQQHATAGQSVQVNELQRQIVDLTQTVQLLTRAQLQGMQPPPQKPTAPQPPDPTQFDFYEPAQLAEFHKLNNAYIQATVRHEVDAAFAPHGATLQDARLNAEYNSVVYQHGADTNFQPTMQAALKLAAQFPSISIPDAYKHMASNQDSSSSQKAAPATPTAKPAQRTMTAQEAAQKAEQAKRLPASQGVSGTPGPTLPVSLRNVGALGRIMYHNQQSGRARPIGN